MKITRYIDMFKPRVVVISGYFSPVHSGHCEYVRLAKEFAGVDGKLIVIVNSDEQSILKKGYSFVPQDDRVAIMSALRGVDRVVLSIDNDRTVCKTLQMLCDEADVGDKPTHFANGGDVTKDAPCPEETVCKENSIELIYGLGDKIQSSSWILDKSVRIAYEKMMLNTPH